MNNESPVPNTRSYVHWLADVYSGSPDSYRDAPALASLIFNSLCRSWIANASHTVKSP